jgi:AcrR family transcriptional regulator
MHAVCSDRYGCAMTVTEAPQGDRREQLLAAAREVLSQHGYERTTVSSIASRANVAQGTFYLYFPSKEALPGALARQLHEALGAATDRATEEAEDLETAIDQLIAEVLREAEAHADVFLVANRGTELCENLDKFLEITAPWRLRLEAFIARYQDRGEIERDIDVTTTACILRDCLDRACKATIIFGRADYAAGLAKLSLRALQR